MRMRNFRVAQYAQKKKRTRAVGNICHDFIIYGVVGRVHTRVRIPGGRLLFPRSYLRSVFRRHICDWIQTDAR